MRQVLNFSGKGDDILGGRRLLGVLAVDKFREVGSRGVVIREFGIVIILIVVVESVHCKIKYTN